MKIFNLTISSPDGNIFEGEISKLDVRGVEGELAVMAGHVPFVTSIVKAPCTLWFEDGTQKTATTDGGLLTVSSDSVILIAGSFKFDE